MKKEETTAEKTAALLITLVVFAPLVLLSTYVGLQLYTWFALPLHAPVITFWQLYGVALMIQYLVASVPKSEDETLTEMVGGMISRSLAKSLVFWGVGAAVHSWLL